MPSYIQQAMRLVNDGISVLFTVNVVAIRRCQPKPVAPIDEQIREARILAVLSDEAQY
jgi:hypothetical protein